MTEDDSYGSPKWQRERIAHLQKELEVLREIRDLHTEVSGRNVTLTCHNIDLRAELEQAKEDLLGEQALTNLKRMEVIKLMEQSERYKSAIKKVVGQFEALKDHQYRKLILKQTFESASENWDEATTLGPGIDFAPLLEALKPEG